MSPPRWPPGGPRPPGGRPSTGGVRVKGGEWYTGRLCDTSSTSPLVDGMACLRRLCAALCTARPGATPGWGLFSVTPGCSVPTARGLCAASASTSEGPEAESTSVGQFSVKPGYLPSPTARGPYSASASASPRGINRERVASSAGRRGKNISILLDGIVSPRPGMQHREGGGRKQTR